MRGLLSDAHKKNAEVIAWEVGEGRVRALQRFLVSACWDEEGVVGEHQLAVSKLMGSPDGVLILDDTGFRKQGNHSCGTGRQYSGSMGKIGNCQVGVFLSYAAPGKGHTLIDRRLYLKKEWFTSGWDEMRKECHVPEDVAPALEENWEKLELRYEAAAYHRRRNREARESHRRRALRKVSW